MSSRETILTILETLYELSGRDRPDLEALARAAGTSSPEASQALAHLERRGLAHATRVRLTLRGLAAAASLRASHRPGSQRLEVRDHVVDFGLAQAGGVSV